MGRVGFEDAFVLFSEDDLEFSKVLLGGAVVSGDTRSSSSMSIRVPGDTASSSGRGLLLKSAPCPTGALPGGEVMWKSDRSCVPSTEI